MLDASQNETLSLRIKAVDMRGLMAQRRHDMRIGKQPNYVDQSRNHLNEQLFTRGVYVAADEPGCVDADSDISQMRQLMNRERQVLNDRAKRSTKKQAYWRTAVLTFSKSAQVSVSEKPPHEEVEAMFHDFAKRHGVRLLWATYHGDETAPHYHAAFEGIDDKGYSLRFNKAELSAEQDHAASFLASRGIERGKPKRESIADGEDPSSYLNRSVKELHEQLPQELAAARDKLEKNQRLIEAAQAKLVTGKIDKATMLKRTKSYERRAKAAATEIARLTALADELSVGAKLMQDHISDAGRELENVQQDKSFAESEATKAVQRAEAAEKRVVALEETTEHLRRNLAPAERHYERAFSALAVAVKTVLPDRLWKLVETVYRRQLEQWLSPNEARQTEEPVSLTPSKRFWPSKH